MKTKLARQTTWRTVHFDETASLLQFENKFYFFSVLNKWLKPFVFHSHPHPLPPAPAPAPPIFKIVDQRIKFYSQNTNLLPPKPKSTFRHLKQGIQDFHRKYVLVPADKAANNVVVVWRLHYINTLKQELSGTKAYKETSEEEKSVVNGHCNHLALKFSVCVKERQDRLPTMYWLPKLHKTPYKARFIANSSSFTTTELSKLLTSCLTAVKNHVIRYCEKVYERSGKNLFWSIKNSGEVLNKLKSRGFRATSL